MADWRQIRARIRRAKAGPDAAMRLEQLFDKTRDGMVAFELAQLEELSGRIERAVDWYNRAWQRFRRNEWRQKAEEALARHGAPVPTASAEEPPERKPARPSAPVESAAETGVEPRPEPAPARAQKPEQAGIQQPAPEGETSPAAEQEEQAPATVAGPQPVSETPARPRRRRHRGGRGRGRGKRKAEEAAKTAAAPESRTPSPAPPRRSKEPERHPHAKHHPAREHLPAVQIYRRGEPALASGIKALEARLRQLLAAQPHSLADLGELPANPGVYLVSDLDLTTMYYLEACGNMRSAMDQLTSGRRGRQGSVRSRLAKYLGITDSQASRYLKQHCVARWIDLEESDSNALSHFARAVLRPELMEDSD